MTPWLMFDDNRVDVIEVTDVKKCVAMRENMYGGQLSGDCAYMLVRISYSILYYICHSIRRDISNATCMIA